MRVLDIKEDPLFGKTYKFEEDIILPYGIDGNMFLDFTSKVPDINFEELDFEICYGLSKINLDKMPMVSGCVPQKIKESEINGLFESEAMYYYDEDKSKLSSLNTNEMRKFLFFRKKTIVPWYFILELKPNIFRTKNKDLYPWDEKISLFPNLKECIEKLPFSEIGRVVIYGSWSESRVSCHRDTPPTSNYSHHINFNPGGYRPVYVYDPVNNTKHYLPSDYKFYAYNTSDYHGVDPLPHFSYTVRVDGIFK
jgi:hypothetical protein